MLLTSTKFFLLCIPSPSVISALEVSACLELTDWKISHASLVAFMEYLKTLRDFTVGKISVEEADDVFEFSTARR